MPFLNVGPNSPSDLHGLRFMRPDGSYDRRAIFARARTLLARWNAAPRAEYFYGPVARRWALALKSAWADARSDRSTLTIRLELRAEEAWREGLPAVEREIVDIDAALRNFEMSDCPRAYVVAQMAPLVAHRNALLSASAC